jgi:hypothetical protein
MFSLVTNNKTINLYTNIVAAKIIVQYFINNGKTRNLTWDKFLSSYNLQKKQQQKTLVYPSILLTQINFFVFVFN